MGSLVSNTLGDTRDEKAERFHADGSGFCNWIRGQHHARGYAVVRCCSFHQQVLVKLEGSTVVKRISPKMLKSGDTNASIVFASDMKVSRKEFDELNAVFLEHYDGSVSHYSYSYSMNNGDVRVFNKSGDWSVRLKVVFDS